jgi:predicted RNase H-like HicB family nuclease
MGKNPGLVYAPKGRILRIWKLRIPIGRQDDGWFVGYLNAYPDHLTQGYDLAELEEMIADVYQIRQEEEKQMAQNWDTHFQHEGFTPVLFLKSREK